MREHPASARTSGDVAQFTLTFLYRFTWYSLHCCRRIWWLIFTLQSYHTPQIIAKPYWSRFLSVLYNTHSLLRLPFASLSSNYSSFHVLKSFFVLLNNHVKNWRKKKPIILIRTNCTDETTCYFSGWLLVFINKREKLGSLSMETVRNYTGKIFSRPPFTHLLIQVTKQLWAFEIKLQHRHRILKS